MTQTQAVYEYLKGHPEEGLTSWEAIQMFGCTRLAAIIFNLKERGTLIESREEKVKTRYGSTTPIARYYYLGEAGPEQLALEGLK